MRIIYFFLLLTAISSSCQKLNRRNEGNLCLEASKTTMTLGESVSISNCGDTPPSEYVTTEIDWGDGNVSNGMTGSHQYDSPGVYSVILLLNGDPADEVTEAESDKVSFTITVTE